jgi:DNA polymerase
MTESMGTTHLRRLVVQHARTAGLLGVDFVPAYRAGGVAPAPGSAFSRDESPAPPAPPAATREPMARGAPSPFPEPKPAAIPSAPEPVPAARRPRDRDATAAALEELRARYEREAPHQHFVTAHTRIVWGDGDPGARLAFVGEAPGAEEDRLGVPFVGRSGELLNKMIAGMGLSRPQVYICNVLKTRPPDNATPTSREIELCEPYLREQLAILAPEVIVTLGLPAARALLKTQESMTRMRGTWRSYALPDGTRIPLMPTFHPAFLLRNYTVEARGQVWSDLQQVMDRLRLPRLQRSAPE